MIIEIDKEQARTVTVNHITHTLIAMKQYLDDVQIAKYKFILCEFATLEELTSIASQFDQAWPTNTKWNQ